MLLPLKVLSTNICAWSFYFEFDYFVVRQSLDVLTSFTCMHVFGSQNGRNKKVSILLDMRVESYTILQVYYKSF
jgi:hypothetical protein